MRVWLRYLASTRLTLALFALLALCVLIGHASQSLTVWALVTTLALLALNLASALLMHAGLRASAGLFIFHIALLILLVLVAIGRLTYFNARVEIAEGNRLAAEDIEVVASGPWHPHHLSGIYLTQGSISVDYAPGVKRKRTQSQVWVEDDERGPRAAIVSEDKPLSIDDYKLYVTHNKGLAVLLTWLPERGTPVSGLVHMPSYPLFDWKQDNRWTPPGGEEIRFWLRVNTPLDEGAAWRLEPKQMAATLIVNAERARSELNLGQSIRLTDGE